MSTYTTTVRYICEYYAGLDDSAGLTQVDSIIDKSWNKIFDDFPIFNEDYRAPLCKKILRHYYMREIGSESVGLWKLWLTNTMREIMPYYNQLYESALITYDPLSTTKYTRTGNEKNTGSETASTSQTNTTTGTTTTSDETTTTDNGTTTGKVTDRKSDTPQGGIDGIESNKYLSEASINDSTGSSSNESNSNSTGSSSQNVKVEGSGSSSKNDQNDKTYSETIEGKTDSVSFAKLIMEQRETFLNIDMSIINELSGLFLNIY